MSLFFCFSRVFFLRKLKNTSLESTYGCGFARFVQISLSTPSCLFLSQPLILIFSWLCFFFNEMFIVNKFHSWKLISTRFAVYVFVSKICYYNSKKSKGFFSFNTFSVYKCKNELSQDYLHSLVLEFSESRNFKVSFSTFQLMFGLLLEYVNI